MKKVLYFIYFKSYRHYSGWTRSQAPLQFLIGINLAAVINTALGFFSRLKITSIRADSEVPNKIAISGGCIILMMFVVSFLVAVNKTKIATMFASFENQSEETRAKLNRSITRYVSFSIILFFVSFFI